MHTDTLQLIDEWGPEKVVCVSDRRSGMLARALASPAAARTIPQQRVRAAMMLRGQIPADERCG